MISPRLREQPQEVQDVFAVARAALDGYEVSREWTEEIGTAVYAAMELWEQIWGDDA